MKKLCWLLLAILSITGFQGEAALPPETAISNGLMRVRFYLPDAKSGFYRGTRFDWSGVIGSLEFAGHEFYPQWFQRCDQSVHDFIYDGADIVAGPCTAITGPAEEFVANGKALGFDEAKAGESFIKIGVGVLRKPDDKSYDPYRLYPIQDGGRWSVTQAGNSVEFTQVLTDLTSGYAYEYRKTVTLAGNKPQMVLSHVLRNTGRRAIQTSVYNHNFLFVDQQAPSPDCSIKLPFNIRTSSSRTMGFAQVSGNQITFSKKLTGEDRVYLDIQGFGNEASDYDIRIENRGLGAGLRITSDRPLSKMALWAIRAPLSIEPFITMSIEPGAEFSWRINYEYCEMPKTRK